MPFPYFSIYASGNNLYCIYYQQLRASEGHLNLQMGYNKGASQSGHGGMGKIILLKVGHYLVSD